MQAGREAAGARVPWTFRSFSLRLAEGAEVAAPASERRHGPVKEKPVDTQKSCPQRFIRASCFHANIRVLCIWDLRFALDLRLHRSRVALA